MKKLFTLFLLITILFSCKVYDSKSTTKEDALLHAGKVKVKSKSNATYKFEKLVEEGNQLYGIGKRVSIKSKGIYNDNIVNENKNDKNVKILLTDNLINEIHLYNKGKTSALKIVGIGLVTAYIIAGLAAIVLIASL